MKAMKLTFVVGIVLVSTSPAFSHFVKAALGFRLGHSPTESRYGQSAYNPAEKKAVGVQVLSGVNNGGWKGPIQAAASSSGYQQVAQDSGRSYGGGGPLDAHSGHGAVKHLRILGLNLYLGGRAANNLGHGIYHKPQPVKKQLVPLVNQPYLAALTKPVTLGAGVGAGLKPVIAHAPNGGKIIGGAGGVRAAVGTPGFGLGFNLGYRQGINTKSPLGLVFGLGGPGKGYYAAPIQKGPIYRGQDQVYIPGGGVLKGHGHDLNHSPSVGGQNPFGGYAYENNLISGLESKQQQFNNQPIAAASINQNQARLHPQSQQASQQHRQQAHAPGKHHGFKGPMSYPSYSRNPFIAFLQGRPSILRPTRLQYNFNNPQSSSSGPIRMMHPQHSPTPAPQRPRHAAGHQESPPQGWSTLYPIGGPQSSATNAFINPLPPNGQPLSKLQASLRPGNPFQYQHAPVTSAQHQTPFIQQAPQNAQPPQQFQRFFSQPLPNQGQFAQPLHVQPQNTFQQYFSNGFQQQQAPAAPQQLSQDFNFFPQHEQSSSQSFPNHPQANFQQSTLNSQQSPYYNQIQEQPVQAATPAQSKQSPFENNPDIPFNPEATPFAPEPGYQYSHTEVSEPMKMGAFTMNMDLGSNDSGSQEPNQAGSSLPMFGPLGRRLKKAKKPRVDGITKKQGTPEPENYSKQYEMLETSASSNIDTITLASSLGSTSWTPIVNENSIIPQIQKKSLETPVSTSVQVVDKKPQQHHQQPQQHQQQPQQQHQQQPQQQSQEKKFISSSPTGSSAILTAPAPSLGPQGQQSDRTMILKKRRLNVSGEMLNVPTVIPAMTSSVVTTSTSTSAAPSSSSSSTTTTTTTTTTTVPPPPSSSSSAPSSSSSSSAPSTSSSSVSPVTVPESTSQSSSSEPVTTTTVVIV